MALLLISGAGTAPASAESVLRVIPDTDLKILDPIWTTAYITRDHAYMVYDTLFALDENFVPQPQMVDTYTKSDDGLVWTFVLRDGLKFHDGAPVTGEDVVASLTRWGARDGMGQQLFAVIKSLEAKDVKTVVMTLKEPYGLVLESIGKLSSNVPVIMPKRIAETDPNEQITEYIGSGPFVFQKDEWVPGSKVVYTKYEGYVPRNEPPSNAAGGKVVKVDKVIWHYFPDSTTAMNALTAGEVDYFKQPSSDLTPILDTNPDITVTVNDPLGSIGFARFNSSIAPFNDPAVRRAAIMAMKQEDYLTVAIGDSKFWKTCYSVYPCGTPLENDAGSKLIATGSVEAAKAALAKTAYDGTPVLLMHPTDVPSLSAFTLMTAQKLRATGFTVELAAMDWSTLASRRASRKPVAEGGWNMFHTLWNAVDVLTPTAIAFSGDPEKGWFGWPEDAELEKARAAFPKAVTDKEKLAIATKVQERLWAIGASGELGQFFMPIAHRNNVKGIIKSPLYFYWNITVE
jgi:peptide/nickel transport system substrate-binding protein